MVCEAAVKYEYSYLFPFIRIRFVKKRFPIYKVTWYDFVYVNADNLKIKALVLFTILRML